MGNIPAVARDRRAQTGAHICALTTRPKVAAGKAPAEHPTGKGNRSAELWWHAYKLYFREVEEGEWFKSLISKGK